MHLYNLIREISLLLGSRNQQILCQNCWNFCWSSTHEQVCWVSYCKCRTFEGIQSSFDCLPQEGRCIQKRWLIKGWYCWSHSIEGWNSAQANAEPSRHFCNNHRGECISKMSRFSLFPYWYSSSRIWPLSRHTQAWEPLELKLSLLASESRKPRMRRMHQPLRRKMMSSKLC